MKNILTMQAIRSGGILPSVKRLIKRSFQYGGINDSPSAFPADADNAARDVMRRVAGFTMTTLEGQATLINTVRYITRHNLSGAMVECGVWRGGSSMAMALTLMQEDAAHRHLYLYDTFQGMTAPHDIDRTADGVLAETHLKRDVNKEGVWCVAGLEDVRRNIRSTSYPEEQIHYIKGPVEETLPDQSPEGDIALLRLDTDWYQSTRHELIHLYPRLVSGGVLIIDDYGYWQGARQAVDEYFAAMGRPYYLHRVDRSARILIKN